MAHGRTNINLPEIKKPLKTTYLYKEGDTCDECTGGWIADYCGGSKKVAWNSNNVVLSKSDTLYVETYTGAIVTSNTIDLKGYKTIHIDCAQVDGRTGNKYDNVCIEITTGQLIGQSGLVAKHEVSSSQTTNNTISRRTYTFDISEINDECYIRLLIANYLTLTVYNVWIEP